MSPAVSSVDARAEDGARVALASPRAGHRRAPRVEARLSAAYTYRCFSDPAQVPAADWAAAQDQHVELNMSLALLRAVHQSMPETRPQALLIYDGARPVAAAVIALMRVDLLLFAAGWLRRCVELVRKIFPSFLSIRMSTCGLPISNRGSALRISRAADVDRTLKCLHEALVDHARFTAAHITVLKEFPPESREQLAQLGQLGYRRADSLPDNYYDMRYTSFAALETGMRSRYRNQLRRTLKTFRASGLRIRRVSDAHEAEAAYTDAVHALHEQVRERAAVGLERLPASFFRALGRELAGSVHFTFAYRGEEIVGFICAVMHEGKYYNLFCGFDYALNEGSNLYFNLMTEDLRHALSLQPQSIHMGGTADRFKERLGCFQVPLEFYYRGARWWFRLLRPLEELLFPPCPLHEARHVFSDEGPPLDTRRLDPGAGDGSVSHGTGRV